MVNYNSGKTFATFKAQHYNFPILNFTTKQNMHKHHDFHDSKKEKIYTFKGGKQHYQYQCLAP